MKPKFTNTASLHFGSAVGAMMQAALANMPNGPTRKEYPEQRQARLAAEKTAAERQAWNEALEQKKRSKR